MKLSKTLALTGIALVLAGCAGNMKEMPDGRVLAMTTVSDGMDRSSSYTQILEPTGRDAEGRPTGYTQVAGDLATGPTVVGQATVAIAGTVPSALIQRDAAIRSSEIKADGTRCPEGVQVCHSNVLQGGNTSSGAVSGSTSNAGANVSIREESCTTCGILD